MANFPTPTQIVEDLNDLNPFIKESGPNPRQGEVEAVKYIFNLAQKFGLGNARIVPLPRTPRYAPYTEKDPELANIVIEAGTGNDELLILQGHTDVVPPKDYRGANHDIVKGKDGELKHLGSHDMLSGVAAILTSQYRMVIHKRRRVRSIISIGEENDSEGTHAAFDESDDLFAFPQGKRGALSTEIKVGSLITDPDELVIGRPGRFTFDLLLEGLMKHAGEVRASDLSSMTIQRLARVERVLMKQMFSKHPDDIDNLLFPGQISLEMGAALSPGSLSTSGEGIAKINVHYANPKLSASDIQSMIQDAIRKALGDKNFILAKSVRTVPWLRPWLEKMHDGTFASTMRTIATQVVSSRERKKQAHARFSAGKGVADENIIGQEMPVVCLPSRGEEPHRRSERGDINGVPDFQVPTIQSAAAHPEPLFPENE